VNLAASGTYCAEHSFAIVVIDVTVRVTGEGDPALAEESELVLIDGDSVPLTSTCCPR
jgi:hypothetical protein